MLKPRLNFLMAVFVAGAAFSILGADTVLVAENFGGDGLSNLAGTVADTFHADLTASGGSSTWGGSANVKTDGLGYGNNAKVVFLNIGSYIDAAKGTAIGSFELSAMISDHPTEVGNGYNFLSFANTSSPAAATTAHTVGSIGTSDDGDQVAYAFANSLSDLQVKASTVGSHTVTIALDLTSTYYNGIDQFGKITLSDSVEGVLGSTILSADQSFSAITMIIDGTFVSRTGTKYSALTLTQIFPAAAKGTMFVFE